MAIQRPAADKKTGPKNKEQIASVGDVIEQKQKKLATTKKTTAKKPATKKAPANKKAAKKETGLLPPKHLKSEGDWKSYLQSVSIAKVVDYLEKKPERINVTLALVLRRIAHKILKLTEKQPNNYNDWLEFFSSMTPEETETFLTDHNGSLDNEASAAGERWLLIKDNPTLIDKIVNSRLEQRKTEELGDIMAASKSGDRVALFEAIRDNIAYKISENAGARDMTVLIKQLNEVTLTLDELYRARGDKGDGNSSVRKLLLKSRKRASRPKASQAAKRISDDEDDEDL